MITTYSLEIEQVTQCVFSTMLNMDLVRTEPQTDRIHESLITSIQVTGSWVGCVVLSLSPGVSSEAAATMLQLPSHEVTPLDEQEVSAELVNIIGGNLKSLLPGGPSLSLPTIVAGNEFTLRIHGAELIEDVWMQSSTGWLRVRLYQKLKGASE